MPGTVLDAIYIHACIYTYRYTHVSICIDTHTHMYMSSFNLHTTFCGRYYYFIDEVHLRHRKAEVRSESR